MEGKGELTDPEIVRDVGVEVLEVCESFWRVRGYVRSPLP